MHLSKFLILTTALFVVFSCKKKEEVITPTDELKNGILIVNEGLFQQNNSSLSWLDFSTNEVNSSIYEQKNGRMLGDTGNDLLKYGGKIYITVSVSSIIEVLDARTGKSIQQISMVNNSTPKQPRQIQAHGGKIYISCFDGYVDVMDTTSLEIIHRIPVGSNPDAMTIFGNKLYVSNTGGLNYPNVDSTVSIINLAQQIEENRITVGKNPGSLKFDDNGNLFVVTARGANTFDTQITRFQAGNFIKDSVYTMNVTKLEKMGSKFLVLESNFTSTALHLFNPANKSFEVFNFIPSDQFRTLYGVQFDPIHQRIYCFDAMEFTNLGYVNVFTSSGSFLLKKKVGLNPSKAAIYE